MELMDAIKLYREEKNISKSELAKLIGTSPSYITELENGKKTNPSIKILAKLKSTLDIPIDVFNSIENLPGYYIDTSKELSTVHNPKDIKIINKIKYILEKDEAIKTNNQVLFSAIMDFLQTTQNYHSKIKVFHGENNNDNFDCFTNEQIDDIVNKICELVKFEIYKIENNK